MSDVIVLHSFIVFDMFCEKNKNISDSVSRRETLLQAFITDIYEAKKKLKKFLAALLHSKVEISSDSL
eukprot:g75399.t1